MDRTKLRAAIDEAERFLAAARAADKDTSGNFLHGNHLTAAAKRASMDLTRALAKLRRP